MGATTAPRWLVGAMSMIVAMPATTAPRSTTSLTQCKQTEMRDSEIECYRSPSGVVHAINQAAIVARSLCDHLVRADWLPTHEEVTCPLCREMLCTTTQFV